jgi:hypothetical protein
MCGVIVLTPDCGCSSQVCARKQHPVIQLVTKKGLTAENGMLALVLHTSDCTNHSDNERACTNVYESDLARTEWTKKVAVQSTLLFTVTKRS